MLRNDVSLNDVSLIWLGKLQEWVPFLMTDSWSEAVRGEYPCAFCVTGMPRNPAITTHSLRSSHVGKALRQAKGTTTNLKSSLVPHSVTSQTNQLHKNNRENAGRWKLLPTLNTVYFSFFSWEGIRTKVPLFLLHLTDVQENNTFFYKCCQVFFLWFQIHQKCVWSLSSGKTCNACMKTS